MNDVRHVQRYHAAVRGRDILCRAEQKKCVSSSMVPWTCPPTGSMSPFLTYVLNMMYCGVEQKDCINLRMPTCFLQQRECAPYS